MTSLGSTRDNSFTLPENCFINKLSSYSQSNCSAAYGMRLLKSNYTGPMVNVRRSSDNVTIDFYGSVQGELGTFLHGKGISLTNWLSGSIGYLTTWYDQSGNGRDLIQTTTTQQPVITSTAITYDGSMLLYNTTNTPLTSGLDTYTFVCNFTATDFSASRTIFEIAPAPITANNRACLMQYLTNYGFSGFASDAFIINNNTTTNRKCVMMCNHNLSTNNIVINDNGTIYSGTTSGSPSALSVSPNAFCVGRNPVGTEYFIGSINEIIIFTNTLTTRESQLYFVPNMVTRKKYSTLPRVQLKGVSKDASVIPTGWRFGFDSQSLSNLTSGNSITSSWSSYNLNSVFTANTTITPINSPVYRVAASGGNNNAITQAPYIEFTSGSSQYLTGGTRTFNVNSGGGFTAVVFCAFTSSGVSFERIFDFGNGQASDNLFVARSGTTSQIYFSMYNGSSEYNVVSGSGTIVQNQWDIYVFRYTASNRFSEIIKNGITVASGTLGATITDKTLSNVYVARSNWTADATSSINIAGLYAYDSYLTDTQISTLSNHLIYSTTSKLPCYPPDYTKIVKVGNELNIGWRSDTVMNFNGSSNTYIDIQDVPVLPLTYCFWFFASNIGVNNTIVGLCDFTRSGNGIQIDIEAGGNLRFYCALPTAWTTATTYTISAFTSYHVTVSVTTSNSVIIYINGSLYQTLTGSGIPPCRSRFIIGASGDGGRGYYGYLADFRVYDYILRADEVSSIYDSRERLQLTYTSPANYLVNNRNWYTNMTLYKSGNYTAVSSGIDPDVQYQLLSSGTSGSNNAFYNQTAIQNYQSFTFSFEFLMSSAVADAFYFYCGSTVNTTSTGTGQNNSYGLSFQVWTGSTLGIYLYNSSGTVVGFSPITNWISLGMWVPVTITYNRGSINTWIVNLAGTDIITYNDSNNASWLASAGNYWGLGGWCGGGTMNLSIRKLELTYTPYVSSISSVNNAGANATKYPIAALTGRLTNITGNTLGNGNYIVSASTENGGNTLGYRAFLNSYNDNVGWASNNDLYNTSTGAYIGAISTIVSGVSYSGEWLQIQLPNAIQLASFNILPRQDQTFYLRAPKTFIIAGSIDGVIWTLVHTGSTTWSSSAEQSFTSNGRNSNKYSYFRLISQTIGTSSDGWSGFQNLSLFGTNSLRAANGIVAYPPAGLTANTTTLTGYAYGNGTYIASASATTNNNPYNVFDNTSTTDTFGNDWGINQYDVNTGVYTGSTTTTVSGVTQSGVWLQIQLPTTIQLHSCSITSSYITFPYVPRSFVIAGSNDGSTWVSLYDTTNCSSWIQGVAIQNIQVNAIGKYKFFRLITRRVGVADSFFGQDYILIDNWTLYDGGCQTPRGLIDGLTWKYYDGYHSESNTYASTNTYRNIATTTNTTNLNYFTNGQYPVSAINGFTIEVFGYFRANVTGTWTFGLTTDDGSYLWIGSNALSGFTTGNANISNGGTHASALVTCTVSLISGVYYPIRILYGDGIGGNDCQFYFTPPSGSATYNGQGYFYTSTGLNQAYPAESAKVIKDLTGTNTDGTYYINVNGVSTPTYCLMNDMYDGGGWMMLMKATTGTTFQYSSSHWTSTSTLNTTDTTRNNADAKYNVFNYSYIKDVMAIWPDINPNNYTNVYGRNGGCFFVNDGWVWKVDNWNGSSRTTALAGFQNGRPAAGVTDSIFQPIGMNNPFHYSGFSSGLFSYLTGSYLHYFYTSGLSSNVRWGFVFNNETADYNTVDAFCGIGMSGLSAGDASSGNGGVVTNINRQARVELYGR